jgi:RNA polymerase sigma-70 factor (ECF subfamily)
LEIAENVDKVGQGFAQTMSRDADTGEVTQLLSAWSQGDRGALERLIPIVYQELHEIAARALRRETPGHTLQTTALVHEAYLKLAGQRGGSWPNRQLFYAVAAQAMRRVLVDHARERMAQKRGGGVPLLPLEEAREAAAPETAADVLAVDAAVERLARIDPRLARIVELKFFGGLSLEEIASLLDISPSTAWREWDAAKAWLQRSLGTS